MAKPYTMYSVPLVGTSTAPHDLDLSKCRAFSPDWHTVASSYFHQQRRLFLLLLFNLPADPLAQARNLHIDGLACEGIYRFHLSVVPRRQVQRSKLWALFSSDRGGSNVTLSHSGCHFGPMARLLGAM